jgi:predicted Zn-dependent protease
MLRHFLVTLFGLAAWSASLALAQELPATVLNRTPELPAGENPNKRTSLELGDEALAAGLCSTAAQLYSEVIADPKLGAKDREHAALGLTAAYIERTRVAEARAALKFIPDSPRKALREGMVFLLENNLAGATEAVTHFEPEQLPAQEIAWGHALKWMIATAKGDNLAINLSLEAATKTAVSEEQRQRIEILGYRTSIIAGRVEDRTLNALTDLAQQYKNSPLAFAYARNLAIAYAQLKKPEEAAKTLAECTPLSPNHQAEADLLTGLILGSNNPNGIQALKKAARNPANAAIRLTALRALVAAAASPLEAKLPDPAQAKAYANDFYDFLMRKESLSSYVCPRDPNVLDAIHLARAQLMLIAGNREKARTAAEELLHDVPASPLAREATRTLALAAWGDGAYRLAATYLTTLAEGTTDARRDVLRTVAADCLFLAKDFVLAEKAYATIQNETSAPDIAATAFHQRIHCLLEQGDQVSIWTKTAQVIEEAAHRPKPIPRERLWEAAWNLVEDARKANQPQEAELLFLRMIPITADAKFDYALRFDWQHALIELANRRPIQAAKLADSIANRLEKPSSEASAELQANIPELRGHVALLKARTALGVGSMQGIEELANIRQKYGKTPATAASYLVEGRYLAGMGKHAEAQARFQALAKEFKDEPKLAEFAQLGLYEAAEEAALQAATDGESKLKDSVELLENFTEAYPQSPLLFRVAMKRAEILQQLGDFDKALLVLEGLIRDKPSDPSRPQAEIARAGALLGLAELRRDRNGQLDRQRVARAAAAYERVAEAWSKDSDDLRLEAQYGWASALLERAKTESNSEMGATRKEARLVLLRSLGFIRNQPSNVSHLGSDGRIWLARTILLLAQTCEQDGDREEAIAAYKLIPELNRNLPSGEARLPGQTTAESKLASLRLSATK